MKAIISDIHSNLEALTAVLDDINKKGIKTIYCLGDVVGYGANPKEAINLAKNLNVVLKGNHDYAVSAGNIQDFTYFAAEGIKWTRKELSGIFGNGNLKFLENLPETHKEGKTLFVHGSSRDPIFEYVTGRNAEKILENMEDDYCFVGHTHAPGIFHYENKEMKLILPSENPIELKPKMIVNVGSVGQPRDGDNRACWVSLDNGKVQYHKVNYDFKKTQEKIIKAGLPEYLAARLEAGK